MPTEAENIQYLYLILTNDGNPDIDWDAVGGALNLNKVAVTKRWSRLRQSMNKDEAPGGSTYQFLWLCVKHHKRTTPLNWAEIATQANTTTGAASKRYSRMKKAFEDHETAPTTASPASNKKNKTPTKPRAKKNIPTATPSSSADDTPKRKRAAAPKKTVADADADEDEVKPKRVKPIPKPKRSVVKKEEVDGGGEEEDAFFDAEENVGGEAGGDGEEELDTQDCKF
ncbi:hypothetical protein BDW02DRAFT_594976 [Decorospora gaudefroyi]|uniref:Myb-like DNA-binding domain-containing protein n=1 Tax=Decorospora gaudefroyi TaxID=184978 RepID=A0A6A5KWT4_9PLEO|nr:hypothetical protein BDW02DRAFT_594976 [Decorospora gaudefroyi]